MKLQKKPRLSIMISEGITHLQRNVAYVEIKVKMGEFRKTLHLEKALLSKPSKVFDILLEKDLPTITQKKDFLREFKTACRHPKQISRFISGEVGFFEEEYVTSAKTYSSNPEKFSIYHENYQFDAKARTTTSRKKYLPLKVAMSDLCNESDLAVIAVATTFAGILLPLSDIKTGLIVFLAQESTTGKTTMLKLGRAFYPPEYAYFTDNAGFTNSGLEDILASHNHQTLFFDEFKSFALTKDAKELVHLIANGSGTSRSKNVEVQSRFPDRKWLSTILAAGESSLLLDVGAQNGTGASVRVIEFRSSNRTDHSKLIARANKAAALHDGYAHDRFVRLTVERHEWIINFLENHTAKFIERCGAKTNFEKRRAKNYALIACSGELMIRAGLLELEKRFFLEKLTTFYQREVSDIGKDDGIPKELRVILNALAAQLAWPDGRIPDKEQLKSMSMDSDDIVGFTKGVESDKCMFIKASKLIDVFEHKSEDELTRILKLARAHHLLICNPNRDSPYKQVSFTDKHGSHKNHQRSFAVFDVSILKRLLHGKSEGNI